MTGKHAGKLGRIAIGGAPQLEEGRPLLACRQEAPSASAGNAGGIETVS
jgi:hypothetical protein